MPDSALSSAAETEPRNNGMPLKTAIALLDPDDDSHWTSSGLPRMEVLEAMTNGNLTRADVEAAGGNIKRSAVAVAKADEPEPEPEPETAPPDPDVPMVAEPEQEQDAADPGQVDTTAALTDAPEQTQVAPVAKSTEERIAALEADLAYLRKTFGWPTKPE